MAKQLGIEAGGEEYLSGNKITNGMDPYAQRYGGHQFGNWAGQLGDGRAITLGEVEIGENTFELQLKGSGVTPAKQCITWVFRQPEHYLWLQLEKMLFEISCIMGIRLLSQGQSFAGLRRVLFVLEPFKFIQ